VSISARLLAPVLGALAAGLLCRAGWAQPPVHTALVEQYPDVLQNDPRAGFAGGGRTFCAPAAVSNSLVVFARNGFPRLLPDGMPGELGHFELVKTLASQEFTNTNLSDGTSAANVLWGVERYVHSRGYAPRALYYEGWRRHDARYSTGRQVPDLPTIKAEIAAGSAVWLNLGWYAYSAESGEYRRNGGHWLTLVGYGAARDGSPSPNVLIVHDPATSPTGREHVDVEILGSGRLVGSERGLPRPAEGYMRLGGELRLKRNHLAILDGVVVLRL